MLKILIVSGSLRKKSYNTSLATLSKTILHGCAESAQVVDLSPYDIPLYNQDIEDTKGFPEGVTKLQQECVKSDLIIFVSPEYNGSIPGVLKNAIDWISRPNPEIDGNMFRGKVGGIVASSPGRLGGIRVLRHLRDVLSHLGMVVLPYDRAFAHIDTTLNQETLEFSEYETLKTLIEQWLALTHKLV